jgi:uncharacterized membrane protein YfcA
MGKITSDIRLACRMIITGFLTALRRRRIRRKIMFYSSAGTIIAAALGFTLFDGFLGKHPLIFAIYWFYCVGLVAFMLLIAAYDIAVVRRELNVRSDKELTKVLKEIEEAARAGNKGSENPKAPNTTK